MIRFFGREHKNWIIIYVLSLCIGLYLISMGPNITPDTSGYILMDPTRSAGYPLFLYALKLFDKSYLWFVLLIQVVIGLSATLYFLKFLGSSFNLPMQCLLLLTIPTLYLIYKYSGTINSESLAFPLFLVVITWLFKGLLKEQSIFIIIALLVNVLLVLVRGQFVLFYPFGITILFYIHWKQKNLKSFVKYLLLILLIYIVNQTLDKTYHYFKHGEFIVTPFTGIQLLTNAVYVANEENYKLFNDKNSQDIFKNIYDTSYIKGYNLNSFEDNNKSFAKTQHIFHYTQSYNELAHRIIKTEMFHEYQSLSGINKWRVINHKCIEMALVLTQANWKDFLRNYILNIQINGFQSFFNLMSFLIVIIILTMGTIKRNEIATVLLFAGLLLLMNYLLVGLVEPIIFRYSFYTDYLFLIFLFIFLYKFLVNVLPNKNEQTNFNIMI